MGKNKGIIGFVLGIVVAVALYFMNIPGLSHEGHMCLTFSLMTVILALLILHPSRILD